MTCSLRDILRHFDNRISEVATASIMIGIGLQIIAAPVPGDYRALDDLLRCMSGDFIAAFFIAVGAIRVAALIANGHWRTVGPWMRSAGAAIGALIWSQMFLSLIVVSPDDLTSLGAPVYFVFTWIELISIYRALAMRGHHGRGG
ncbi:hypothetical protein OCAR_5603 [Afipia carboxidovorans OM5]|uniref:Putative transmembran protein n=1 Tax=Afipia carboxidovorans (strain ATCC 49405 / DSM 1227 / KCTC 32145 / OM5) TaxID=504832 RepID=B6JEG9_AFIC5|nr:hypothetical protein [Afipia carboxidovorans]ACI92734.1 hypothetical protein OCAR_5603 [Afipia carboxidovorans OM5]AEI03514.1 putative transmembran protein [Afipia carboxidovorans OM4]AEI07091.1 putative transmembran protein [Afipia carboxidovorans OM5]